MRGSVNRLSCLDGLRGWAALTVVLGHLTRDIIPFNYLLFTPFTDTRLAVGIFFIISGFVLSYRFIGRPIEFVTLIKIFVARYVRLVIPIAVVSLLILFFGFDLAWLHNIKASQLDPTWGFGSFYAFKGSFIDAVKFSFWNVFVNYDNNHTYIPPAWTMPRELLGSYFIYVMLFMVGFHQYWNRRRFFVMLIAAVAFLVNCLHFHYAVFFLYGYLLAEFYKSRIQSISGYFTSRMAFLTFVVLMILSAFHSPNRSATLLLVGMSFIGVWSVLYSPQLSTFFSNRFSQFLGKISFPLYLIHVPIYCTFSSWFIDWAYGFGLSHLQMYSVVFLSSVLLAILCAYLLYPVELFAIHLSRRINGFSFSVFLRELGIKARAFE